MISILDFLFPKRCVSCRRWGAFFCPRCISKLQTVRDICSVCEQASVFGITHPACSNKYSLDGLISGFYYQPPLKETIHRFKYKPYITGLSPVLAELLVKALKNNKSFKIYIKNNPTLVPVPLHWWRKHLRGYNQIQLIVTDLSRLLNLTSGDLLERIKLTKPQSGLTYQKRQQNVADIFQIKKEFRQKKPSCVILVDDVWTSGSTLKSACRTLKKNGIQSVWALTLAR